MQNVFYKIKFKDFSGHDIERTHDDINNAKTDYNTMLQTSGISNVKLFIVNETEEELSIEQLPN